MGHAFTHFLISAGMGVAGFLATGWLPMCFIGAAFYAVREMVQYGAGKRHKGGFDVPGLLGGLFGAAPAVALWQWWPVLLLL